MFSKSVKAVLLFAVAFCTLHAADIFVSPAGNDTNNGSETAPLKTIQKAVSSAKAGDTIKLMPGIYREDVVVNFSGTPEKPLKIIGTRSESGEYLAILEAKGTILGKWTSAPEIGENVWKTPLKSRPEVVLLDGKSIAQINRANMVLKRRKPLPEKLTQDLIWGDHSRQNSKRLAGLDMLAVKSDIKVTHQYFKGSEVPFWSTIGNVLCGWSRGNLYIRFAGNDSPDKHYLTCANGNAVTVKDASNVILSDLHIRGGKYAVQVAGKSRNISIENSLLMHGNCRIKVEKESQDTIIRNNIITSGFIQDQHFKSRRRDDMRGGLLYIIFKYVIGIARSNDAGISFSGKNCCIRDNVIINGLLGIDAKGPGAEVCHNGVRCMSSCGIVTGGFSSGKFYENVVENCGIALRLHDWRHERFYRTEYHYRNLFIQPETSGIQTHIFSASSKSGHDKVNFDRKGIYLENPPAPFDPGKIFVYHNTFVGGSGNPWPVKNYYDKFRKQPMPFYYINNINKSTVYWNMSHQNMLAGNLLYTTANAVRKSTPDDETVKNFNRITTPEMYNSIFEGNFKGNPPDVRLKENSPALECGIDVSREQKINGVTLEPLPGFEAGYFSGKTPAAGAIQQKNVELMKTFENIVEKVDKANLFIQKSR